MFSTGELYIRRTDPLIDGMRTYYCQTRHRISGAMKQSSSSGRIIITGTLLNWMVYFNAFYNDILKVF